MCHMLLPVAILLIVRGEEHGLAEEVRQVRRAVVLLHLSGA